MIWTLIVLLLVLWALGFGVFHLGAIIHALLVIAVIVILFNLLTGRRTTV